MMTSEQFRVLGPVDNAFYFVEKPETPMNLGAVAIFDGHIPFQTISAIVRARIHRAPIYRKKVVQPPLSLGQPMWADDPNFKIHNHLYHHTLPSPGYEDTLRELAGRLVSQTLDRSRPLWSIHVIDNVNNAQTALLLKVHHAMVDGLAAIELFTLLFDPSPEPSAHSRLEEVPTYDPEPELDTGKLLWESFRRDLPYKATLVQKLGKDFQHFAQLLGDRQQRRRVLHGISNLISDNLKPIYKLPIAGQNSGDQSLAWVTFSLSDVRAIKSQYSVSVNDVMLSLLSDALDRYLSERGIQDRDVFVRALVPVNMRGDENPNDYGNRISLVPIDMPVGVNDPEERLNAIAHYARVMKDASISNGVDIALTIPSLLPSTTQPLLWSMVPGLFSRLAHTWCTNVAGPPVPVYLEGQRLQSIYGFFPINPSMGLSTVIVSYNGYISMTLVTDNAIVPEGDTLREYLGDAFNALAEKAGVTPTPVENETAPTQTPGPPSTDSNDSNGAYPTDTSNTSSVADKSAEKPEDATTDSREAKVNSSSEPPPLFSEAWATGLRDAINSNRAYYRASTGWTEGPLALVVLPSRKNGNRLHTAVWLDLHKGKCNDARILTPDAAEAQSNFVLEGYHEDWMSLLNGETQPFPMLLRGRLKLRKGSMRRLMPFTRSAQELIRSARNVK